MATARAWNVLNTDPRGDGGYDKHEPERSQRAVEVHICIAAVFRRRTAAPALGLQVRFCQARGRAVVPGAYAAFSSAPHPAPTQRRPSPGRSHMKYKTPPAQSSAVATYVRYKRRWHGRWIGIGELTVPMGCAPLFIHVGSRFPLFRPEST